jgi:hypothetical protein
MWPGMAIMGIMGIMGITEDGGDEVSIGEDPSR